MNDAVRRYVPTCAKVVSPAVWVRARNAKSIPQAYHILTKIEDRLPIPLVKPACMLKGKYQIPVEFMGRSVRTQGGKFSPISTPDGPGFAPMLPRQKGRRRPQGQQVR